MFDVFLFENLEVQKQYDVVVSKYKDTDLWLQAPNGKPSNLSESQWVMVRTQNFKNWFGDWELGILLNNAKTSWNDSKAINKFCFLPEERLRKELSSMLGFDVKLIVVTNETVRHIKKKHSQKEEFRGQVNMTPEDVVLLPYLLNNFDSIEYAPEYDRNNKRALKVKKRINGEYVVGTLERANGNIVTITEYERKKSDVHNALAEGLNVLNESDIDNVKHDIENIKFSVDNVSKMVDENGEPLLHIIALWINLISDHNKQI